MQKLIDIQPVLTEAIQEAEKFETKGNKAAGTRARGKLMDVQKMCKDARVDLLSRIKG